MGSVAIAEGPSRILSLALFGRYKLPSSESEEVSRYVGFFFAAFRLGAGFLRYAHFLGAAEDGFFFLEAVFLLSGLLLIFNN